MEHDHISPEKVEIFATSEELAGEFTREWASLVSTVNGMRDTSANLKASFDADLIRKLPMEFSKAIDEISINLKKYESATVRIYRTIKGIWGRRNPGRGAITAFEMFTSTDRKVIRNQIKRIIDALDNAGSSLSDLELLVAEEGRAGAGSTTASLGHLFQSAETNYAAAKIRADVIIRAARGFVSMSRKMENLGTRLADLNAMYAAEERSAHEAESKKLDDLISGLSLVYGSLAADDDQIKKLAESLKAVRDSSERLADDGEAAFLIPPEIPDESREAALQAIRDNLRSTAAAASDARATLKPLLMEYEEEGLGNIDTINTIKPSIKKLGPSKAPGSKTVKDIVTLVKFHQGRLIDATSNLDKLIKSLQCFHTLITQEEPDSSHFTILEARKAENDYTLHSERYFHVILEIQTGLDRALAMISPEGI
ncbi:hypothetical protein AB0D08_21090 [Kitasatospora sp. NPDC048540]|uniref:hypothetical protein n=1 Tax=Kitasatospora sp. NPDC048540 TaxID=3155634 RepID=UPI0033C9CC21